MNSIFHISGTTLTILLPVEMDHHNAEQIRREADYLMQARMIRTLIFDFSQTEFMDSSGIGMLIGRYKTMRFMGGTVAAVHVSERMRKILSMSGICRMIDIRENTVDESPIFGSSGDI